ncbi:hypothetical protein EVAR_75674_1 [Eumeta japonica]|uniref:Uncharacterized protein n=1 Tax=Eumeta variegata TaxID=151549 RepID=A0A4C1U059_EUMVA|nr:hypothetical protein EVAR_75674_1 [Eumeta japonica]
MEYIDFRPQYKSYFPPMPIVLSYSSRRIDSEVRVGRAAEGPLCGGCGGAFPRFTAANNAHVTGIVTRRALCATTLAFCVRCDDVIKPA